jgi:hypothetical protein
MPVISLKILITEVTASIIDGLRDKKTTREEFLCGAIEAGMASIIIEAAAFNRDIVTGELASGPANQEGRKKLFGVVLEPPISINGKV